MKRIVVFLMLAALSFGAAAQKRIPLLDRVPGHRVSCQYVYSLSKDEEPFKEVTSGHLMAEANAFALDGLGLEMRSDGTTRWSIDPEGREVLVETVQKDDLLANPAQLLGSYRRYMNRIEVLSSSSDALTFTFRLDEDVVAHIVLTDVVFSDPKGTSDFSLDEKSLGKDYVVTDLR